MSPPSKKCAVCGDKALGYNFNAVTCESCKAFFRRNALAKKQFNCPFNQNCDINVVTRRFCQKCRLKKCIDIGMKSENIMSEEDKLIKRRKIETNRVKRRLNERKVSGCQDKHDQRQVAADSSGYDATISNDSQSCGSFESATGTMSGDAANGQPSSSTVLMIDSMCDVKPELMTGEEIVEFIVGDPDRACQAISKLMRTPVEAVTTLGKIINSQKDALRLISHLISYPGDALKIISKIMNSPFNALTVFTKFMSSPTDALEIISKIVSSPQDVLQFIKNLMDSPEDALDIMNKFMNTPAEALKMINKLFNGSNPTNRNESLNELHLPASMDVETPFQSSASLNPRSPEGETSIIHSMLNSSPSANHEFLLSPITPQLQAQHPPLNLRQSSMYTSSPQAMSISSPISVTVSDMHHSPTSIQHDEMPSTSATFLPASPRDITSPHADFANEHFDIKNFIQNSIPDNSNHSDNTNSLESVLSEVIRIEFQAFNNLPQEPRVKQEQHPAHVTPRGEYATRNPHLPVYSPSSIVQGRDLNETEQMKLRELKLASEALYYPVDDDLTLLMMGNGSMKAEDTRQDPKLLQVINLTAVAIKRLIKMAKKITAFRDMCQEDQVALLKGGCTEMMIMRSVMTYDDNRNTWKVPHTKEDMYNIRAEVLKLAKGNVYEEHLKFIRTFDEKWRMDENIILIMCAIVLFTPSRPRIIHSDVIRLEQNSYYYLLRRYLESVYAGCEAKSAFIKLIQKVSDVERLNQFIIGVYLNVNPSQVEPLLREIFDLKNY